MTIRSMTGFGSAEGEIGGGGRIAVEVRSVNHRFFNPSLKLPSAVSRWENEAREILRRRIARGHVTLMARIGTDAAAGPRIDGERFGAYLHQLRTLAAEHGIAGPIDVETVMRLPHMVTSDETVTVIEDPAAFLDVVDRAAEALDAMRAGEGAKLGAVIEERLVVMSAAMQAISARAPSRLVEQRDRLRAAVRELVDGAGVDDQRIAQEIAILADRLDVSEEIQRFEAHLQAFRATIATPPPDGVGKRLGFLIQELLREANTTGSKSNDTGMVREVLVIKEELERVREQVENLE